MGYINQKTSVRFPCIYSASAVIPFALRTKLSKTFNPIPLIGRRPSVDRFDANGAVSLLNRLTKDFPGRQQFLTIRIGVGVNAVHLFFHSDTGQHFAPSKRRFH